MKKGERGNRDEVRENEEKKRIHTLWMWGKTPPPAIVARINWSSSSSPRMASCKCRGVIRFTRRSLAALPGGQDGYACTCGQTRQSRRLGLTSKLEDLGGQVLHDGSDVNGSLGSNSNIVCILVPQEPDHQYERDETHASILTCGYVRQGTRIY
jgi:hypothetical protein